MEREMIKNLSDEFESAKNKYYDAVRNNSKDTNYFQGNFIGLGIDRRIVWKYK